jgi:hypothetical protein
MDQKTIDITPQQVIQINTLLLMIVLTQVFWRSVSSNALQSEEMGTGSSVILK